MKNSLGKSIIFLLLITALYAQNDFTHKFTLSNTNPYLKEAITLKLDIEQTDNSKVMLFKFDLKKSKKYKFWRIDTKTKDAYHALKVSYTYLIYPLQEGAIELEFTLLQMLTTDDKVAFSFSGDRDNTRGLNKTDIPISLSPLTLDVKAIPKETDIVGDFALLTDIKKYSAEPYEPLPLQITITGEGYPPYLASIVPSSSNYSLFTEAPIAKSINSSQGTQNSFIYPLALSAKESFDLEPITLRAFNPKTQKPYQLQLPKQHFTILKPNIQELVNSTDNPKPLVSDWSWLGSLLGYISIFIAGFLSAKVIEWRKKETEPTTQKDSLEEEIKNTKDPKKLLALLLSSNQEVYKERIEHLEKRLYR